MMMNQQMHPGMMGQPQMMGAQPMMGGQMGMMRQQQPNMGMPMMGKLMRKHLETSFISSATSEPSKAVLSFGVMLCKCDLITRE